MWCLIYGEGNGPMRFPVGVAKFSLHYYITYSRWLARASTIADLLSHWRQNIVRVGVRDRRMISSTANVNKRWRPVALLRAGRQIPHIPTSEIKDARYVWQSSGQFSWIEGMRCVCVCVCLPFRTSSPSNLVILLASFFLDNTFTLLESQFLMGFTGHNLV